MKLFRLFALLLLLTPTAAMIRADDKIAALTAARVAAEDKGRYIKILTEANTLADSGRENKSPLMLVTAGGLYLKLKGTESKFSALAVEPTEEFEAGAAKPAAPKEAPKTKYDFAKSADEQFDAAEALADKDTAAAVRAMIKAVKANADSSLVWAKDRGCAFGPQAITRILPRGATHTYKIHFVGGLPATVGFRSDAPCQVSIVKSSGELVAAGAAFNTARTWIPGLSAKPVLHVVRVKNLSAGPVTYQLLSN